MTTAAYEAISRQHAAGVTHINGRGLGGRPDHASRAPMYGAARTLIGDSPAPNGSASLARYECACLDQGQTGSCTGHGTVQALACSRALSFVASPNGIYCGIRCEERTPGPNGVLPPLTDSGGMPADIVTVLQKIGVRPIQAPTADGRYSDVDPATVNNEPELNDLATAAMTVETGAYLIDFTAPNASDQIAAALDAGYAIGIAVFVDSAFEAWGSNWTPTTAPVNDVNLNDPNGGGHWMCLNEYTSINGVRVFAGINSWSTSWGAPAMVDPANCPNAGGHYRVTEAWLLKACAQAVIFQFGAVASKKAAV